jgi:hypothetical protein
MAESKLFLLFQDFQQQKGIVEVVYFSPKVKFQAQATLQLGERR